MAKSIWNGLGNKFSFSLTFTFNFFHHFPLDKKKITFCFCSNSWNQHWLLNRNKRRKSYVPIFESCCLIFNYYYFELKKKRKNEKKFFFHKVCLYCVEILLKFFIFETDNECTSFLFASFFSSSSYCRIEEIVFNLILCIIFYF